MRYHQGSPSPLQCVKNVPQDVQHVVGGFEVVPTIRIVDVVYFLLEVGSVLHLLDLPRVVLGDGGPLYLLLLPLRLEVDVRMSDSHFSSGIAAIAQICLASCPRYCPAEPETDEHIPPE